MKTFRHAQYKKIVGDSSVTNENNKKGFVRMRTLAQQTTRQIV